jgi:hypothetical protein
LARKLAQSCVAPPYPIFTAVSIPERYFLS